MSVPMLKMFIYQYVSTNVKDFYTNMLVPILKMFIYQCVSTNVKDVYIPIC